MYFRLDVKMHRFRFLHRRIFVYDLIYTCDKTSSLISLILVFTVKDTNQLQNIKYIFF